MRVRLSVFHLIASLLLLSMVSFVVPASAQLMLPKPAEEVKAPSDLENVVEQARKNGSTVVIIKPDGQILKTDVEDDGMRAGMFLDFRKKIGEIVSSAPHLPKNIRRTLDAVSPDGTWFWLLRAVATAVIGLLLGSYVTTKFAIWMLRDMLAEPENDPETTADKIFYLLKRAFMALIAVAIGFSIAMLIAIIFDSGHEPSRRAIFEIAASYTVYRFLRHGVSWNLYAGGMPKYRLVNLSDEEAVKLHRDFHLGVLVACVFAALARFLSFTGVDQIAAGIPGVLTMENIKFLQLMSASLISLLLAVYMIKNWRVLTHIFAPADRSASFFRLRNGLARISPFIFLVYAVAALGVFAWRLALDEPSPGAVIAAPFLIFYAAIIVYGIVLIIVQVLYNRRIYRFKELAAAELERQNREAELVDAESGEEMISAPAASSFEYQPMFRSFFENSALAIIITVSLGELGRIWGVRLGEGGNSLPFLDIGLAAVLCMLAYKAITVFIDKRMEEEGGIPDSEEEMGGEGGGAGATRMATLLPIFKYVLVSTLFFVAVMIVLSQLGFDIGPIFAGAGVVGIAVGFGAQTLIRDIFSGAFFLLDDAFRKGEYVDIEGVKGTVEKISIRSFQLRHHLGALHTIPFGEIRQLTNFSRDWVMMKLPLRVTYDTDVEKVRKLVKKLGQQLLEHPDVGYTFMQPLKSQGVYKMEDSAMIIRVKFMTKPGEQFVTRKVVYQSIQDLFAREGIHFAHKEVTVRLADETKSDELTEEEKKAVTAAARSVIDAEEEERLAAEGSGKETDGGR